MEGMSMAQTDRAKTFSEFTRKFQDSFWWAAPLSVIADVVAILSLGYKQQSIPAGASQAEHRIWGPVTISDAVFLTGLFTLLIIVSIVYLSIILSKMRGDLWPYIFGSFLVLILVWFYFRLWLGEYGWLWVLLAFVFICGIATYLFSKTPGIDDFLRTGCIVSMLTLVVLTVFLLISVGAPNKIVTTMNSIPTVVQNDAMSNQPPQQTELVQVVTQSLPTRAANYIPYDLAKEKWFPAPLEIWAGLFAGEIGEVANQDVPGVDARRLELFQSWGRITSYQRFYSQGEGCNSKDIQSVYIQIIFFQSSAGSKSFFDWAHEGVTVKFVETMGENAYIYSWSDDESGCQNDYVSTTFQRYNVIARARVSAVAEKMDYESIESLSLSIARMIDERLKSALE
jgi:hypothetical protein